MFSLLRVAQAESVKPEDSTSSPETQFQPAQSSPLAQGKSLILCIQFHHVDERR